MDNHLKVAERTEDELRVSNYLLLFGGEDLHEERFAPDVDVESPYTKTGLLYVDWEHGFDPDGDGPKKDDLLGYVDWKTAKRDEVGIWAERVLDRRNKYIEYLDENGWFDEGFIGSSTEAVAGKTQRSEDGTIKSWPLKRDTLTVGPAEPRMLNENAINAMKALAERFPELKSAIPEGLVQPGETETGGDEPDANKTTDDKELTMSEKEKETPAVKVEDLEAIKADVSERAEQTEGKIDELTENINKVLGAMQEQPALKSAGYYTDDGGEADPEHKSFADFLLAIKRDDKRRLDSVYKAMSGESGGGGGYLVPEDFANQVYAVAEKSGQVYPLVSKFPVKSPTGKWPALDQFTAPTAGVGDTAHAGGLTANSIAEGSAGSGTQPVFMQIEYALNKIGDYVEVPEELLDDSGVVIEGLLSRLFGLVMSAKKEYSILRGTGANEPLGILNADAAVGITPATNNFFVLEDAVEMLSRFHPIDESSCAWIMHRGMMPDFDLGFQAGTAGMDFIQPRDGIPQSLLGYPIIFSQHSPQDDNSGCVVLADLSAYAWFEKGGLQIDFSEHVNFKSDQVVWRFKERYDGQPWVANTITLADPNGSFTVSPYVYFND